LRTLDALVHAPLIERIAWTLLHFLWQGTVIAALLGLALYGLRRQSAQLRYSLACVALLAMSLCPVVTYQMLKPEYGGAASRGGMRSPALHDPFVNVARRLIGSGQGLGSDFGSGRGAATPRLRLSPAANRSAIGRALAAHPRLVSALSRRMHVLLPWLAVLWLAGVAVLSARLLGGWVVVQRLSHRAARPITGALYATMEDLAHRIGIQRLPRLLVSDLIQVPTVIGCLRSVILLPASAVAGLSPDMLETILLHELAHIRRYDYLVNLWQSAVETVLFYHPAVWWVSQTIRTEREHCCDDLVIVVLNDRKTYARALAGLEELRARPLALAATDGSLLRRIRRILGERTMQFKITSHALLGVVGLSFLLLGFFIYLKVAPVRANRPMVSRAMPAPATPTPFANAIAAESAPTDLAIEAVPDNAADFSGLTELHGPGVVLTVRNIPNPPKGSGVGYIVNYRLQDQDLQALVNELFAEGAEAISIGDQRIVSRSIIRRAGPSIQVNGVSMNSPFVIKAIGNPDALSKVAGLAYGPEGSLQRDHADLISLECRYNVIVPAFHGDTQMHYARQTAQHIVITSPPQAVRGDDVTVRDLIRIYNDLDAQTRAQIDAQTRAQVEEARSELQKTQVQIQWESNDRARLKAEQDAQRFPEDKKDKVLQDAELRLIEAQKAQADAVQQQLVHIFPHFIVEKVGNTELPLEIQWPKDLTKPGKPVLTKDPDQSASNPPAEKTPVK